HDGVDVGPRHARVVERLRRGLAHEPRHRDVLARRAMVGLADPDHGNPFTSHQPFPSSTTTMFCCRHGPDDAWATPRPALPSVIRRATSPIRIRPALIIGLAASGPPDGLSAAVPSSPSASATINSSWLNCAWISATSTGRSPTPAARAAVLVDSDSVRSRT